MGIGGTSGLLSEHSADRNEAYRADDGVLAGRIRAGSAEALGELFDRHAAAALAAAGSLVRDRAVAEDIVHDAFVTVWRTIGEFDGNGSGETLASWVLALTRELAIDRLPKDSPTLPSPQRRAEQSSRPTPIPTAPRERG